MKIFLLLALLAVACVEEKSSPDGALRDFVEARLGGVVTRQFVLERVAGNMLQSFENMSDEDFEKFADLRSVKKDSFKILSKSCQEKKCFVTYAIAYTTLNNEKPAFNSEVKKIAEIVQLEGKWLIADISNIKTYHESLEPITPLD